VEHSLIPGKTVGADLSRTLPIYRPCFSSTHLPNAPLNSNILKKEGNTPKSLAGDYPSA